MDLKGETYSADHCTELLKSIHGLTNEEGLAKLGEHGDALISAMKDEQERNEGFTPLHSELWTKLLNVKQAIRAGNGELQGWRSR